MVFFKYIRLPHIFLLVPSFGCSSMTKMRFGQVRTGGHIAITEPGLSMAKADEGIGFKVQLGHLQLGYTTTLDPTANHLAVGIESSTGFDGEDTLITSATRVGVANVSVGGKLAVGFGRITLEGVAEIDNGFLPAIYADHWTGATAKYVPFPEATGDLSGNMLGLNSYLTFGPFDLASGLGILSECRPGSFECDDGQCGGGIGPFLLDLGATSGECSHGFGFGGYLGITDAPDAPDDTAAADPASGN